MNRQRAACGAAVAATGAAGLGWWLTAAAAALLDAARSPVPLSPEDAVALLAACLGLLLLLWLALGVLATVLSLLPGRVGAAARRIADRVAPALSRRLAAVIVGASLGGALAPGTALARDGRIVPRADVVTTAASPNFAPEAPAAPAFPAATGGPGWGPAAEPVPDTATAPAGVAARSAAPAPGWVPDRPLVRRQPSPRLVATSPPREERPGVVVRRGDTLWAIARQHLGPGATDAEVAQEWPRWHQANQAVIGPDPDRLLPGMVLQAPTRAVVRR
ncbi:MAG TPA: LysM peptidoglycan-binding domain-containing protein [Pedococcus sp.]|nr:LysM peptidoglycan-binding domain-containing protein [Pedococcus sp.]